MKRCEVVVLTGEDFGEDLWVKVTEMLKLLTKAGYCCIITEEDKDIIVIEYNYNPCLGYGNSIPYWLLPEEIDIIAEEIND